MSSQQDQGQLEQRIGEKMQSWMSTYQEIAELRKAWRESWAANERPEVEDYRFQTLDGEVTLSELFGDGKDLIVIHNMGQSCTYCTLWADGFIGLAPHLTSRAAFVISSPDDPESQRDCAQSRGWPFRMVSLRGTRFAQDMGFADDEGSYMPGFSTFHRDQDGRISRVAHDFFGPGDVYCGIWHMFDHLADGSEGWQPGFEYGEGGGGD